MGSVAMATNLSNKNVIRPSKCIGWIRLPYFKKYGSSACELFVLEIGSTAKLFTRLAW